ncbi:menaquinone-specific isochorismate synthase [Diaminobutyricimonas aerilata]|uniref:isochorismate synthase n=1 Tax=Diaminobutyricimonas aerilata TaxID=1162967 RepID=A0A2M9CGE0_9MICO|nr:isochorismate synthase [Diaminobutyricimonas aerilata]PJJ70930.1 menaquinone-specific isochorismate synthase [Diaminobutyricimonas aerilata]
MSNSPVSTLTDLHLPALTARSRPCDEIDDLLPYADPRHPLVFLRRGDGIVGVGEALRLEFHGPRRISDAADAWRRVVATATIDDQVRRAGSGLIAFGSFAFADHSAESSVLVVPRMLFGRREGVCWVTEVSGGGGYASSRPRPIGSAGAVRLSAGTPSPEGFVAAVGEAVDRIRSGELSKVVLARSLTGRLPDTADRRAVLASLATAYPDTWTHAVDGLFGSSPETLVSVHNRTVTARVLAGSTARGEDAAADRARATALATSSKDLGEHGYALRSVLGALRPFSTGVAASEQPFTLKLPNLWHLASDVEGTLAGSATVLDLVAALHPTAAVAGSPREVALRTIADLERHDRGRYAGPVGWVDEEGDGDWAIALRGAQLSDDGMVTAFAGAGIVAESVPERELAETSLKFRPVLDALA